MLSIVSTLTNYIIFICFFTTQSKIYSLRHLSIARVSKTQAIGSSCRAFVRMTTTSSTTVISSKDSFPIDTVLDKPAIDPRDYLQFILPNEIVVTVVSDVTSEKSSAALAVDVGASADTLAGLAHMTEHAVFLGSEKYPIENAYKDYLNKNGGSSNGGTSMEKTTYKFQVNAKAFPHALDIFSQFFKKPLFDTDAISREVMAVDAEDSKNRIIDGRRTLQVLKDQIVPTSPYAKFSTGNVKTLAKNDPNQFGNELAEEIRRFHSTYYRPENMALSLVGPQSVEELKKLAEEMFGDIKSTEYEEIKSDTNNDVKFGLFKDGGAKMLRIKPVKDIRDMSIIWEVPPTRNFYRNSPTRLLGHLLGHKGEGSIFALLQDKGWATGVSAGIRTTYVDFSLFEVSVSLTPEGEKHIPEIESIIYSYINLIFGSSLKTMSNIWSEICSINSLEFQYQERSTPYELAPYLASTMLDYPLNHVLSAGWLLDNDFPTDLMINFLNKLKRDKSMIIIRSKSFAWLPDDDRDLTAIVKKVEEVQNQKKHILIEPHYGVPYDFSPLEEIGTDSQEYNSVLQLPKPNTYISTELIGKEMDTSRSEKLRSSPPQLIYNGQIPGKVPVDVWHSTDEVFKQPRSVLTMLMYTKETEDGHPLYSLITSVFSQLTARKFYQSSLAGISGGLSISRRGLSLTYNGFSSKLLELHKDYMEVISDETFWKNIDDSLIHNLKERLLRSLQSWVKDRPDSQCDKMMSYLFSEGVWLPQERIKACEEITPESLRSKAVEIIKSYHKVSAYSHGDLPSDVALTAQDLLVNKLSSTDTEVDNTNNEENIFRARIIPIGHTVLALPGFNPEDPNSALLTHIQMESTSPKTSALLLILRRLLGEPAFTQLRTKKQLGYVVSLFNSGYGSGYDSVRGLTVRILSNRFSPIEMEKELGNFFLQQKMVLEQLTEEEIKSLCESLVKSLQDPPTTYTEEASEFWDAVISGMPFDWLERVIKVLEEIKKEDVVQSINKWIYTKDKKSVSVMMFGKNHVAEIENMKTVSTDKITEASEGFFKEYKDSNVIYSVEDWVKFRDTLPLFSATKK